MIREFITSLARRVLPSFGISPKDIEFYRDVLLSLLALVPIFLASKPVFFLLDGERPSAFGVETALIWLIVAVLISVLSVNWNFVLGVTFAGLALRGVVGLAIRLPS